MYTSRIHHVSYFLAKCNFRTQYSVGKNSRYPFFLDKDLPNPWTNELRPYTARYRVNARLHHFIPIKTFHQCYNCIKKDFVLGNGQANCDGTTRSYRFRGWVDPVTQERQIECLNEIGSCKERFQIF